MIFACSRFLKPTHVGGSDIAVNLLEALHLRVGEIPSSFVFEKSDLDVGVDAKRQRKTVVGTELLLDEPHKAGFVVGIFA